MNMLLFTLDEYSMYQEQLRNTSYNDMPNFVNSMKETVKSWKNDINKYQSLLNKTGFNVVIKRSSKDYKYDIFEIENTSDQNIEYSDCNNKSKNCKLTKSKSSTSSTTELSSTKLSSEESPDSVDYESDSENVSSNNSDDSKGNNTYNIFITRGNSCKEELKETCDQTIQLA